MDIFHWRILEKILKRVEFEKKHPKWKYDAMPSLYLSKQPVVLLKILTLEKTIASQSVYSVQQCLFNGLIICQLRLVFDSSFF